MNMKDGTTLCYPGQLLQRCNPRYVAPASDLAINQLTPSRYWGLEPVDTLNTQWDTAGTLKHLSAYGHNAQSVHTKENERHEEAWNY